MRITLNKTTQPSIQNQTLRLNFDPIFVFDLNLPDLI